MISIFHLSYPVKHCSVLTQEPPSRVKTSDTFLTRITHYAYYASPNLKKTTRN